MAAKPTKTSSAMIRCIRPPDLGVLIGNLQSTHLLGGSLSQSWAGTLTQRHERLIGTAAQRVESAWPRPSSRLGGLETDGPGPGEAGRRCRVCRPAAPQMSKHPPC